MNLKLNNTRRKFLYATTAAGAGLILSNCAKSDPPQAEKPKKEEEGVSPAEDLMREHGVLSRVLLIYEVCEQKLRLPDGKTDLKPEVLANSARIIRSFIEAGNSDNFSH